MGDYLWYYEQFDFKYQSICKKPSALFSFIAKENFEFCRKDSWMIDSLSVVNK